MDQDPKKNVFNLKDILLPKKEERTPASASRANAGALLENEQKAELPKKEAPAPITPPPTPVGPAETTNIAPLQTYQSDVESVISKQNVSVVSMAAAEAERNAKLIASVTPDRPKRDWSWLINSGIVVGSIILVASAVALLMYVILRPAPSVTVQKGAVAPFIAVDDTQALVLAPEQFNRTTLMQNLESVKQKTALSLGFVSRTYVTISTTTLKANEVPPPVTIQQLLSTLAPNVTSEFLRTLDPTYYVLGTHAFDENQAFLIMRVDSYERAFAGMIAWERTMQAELNPLFSRNPRPRLAGEVSSTTPQTILIPTAFRDKVVSNHDARVILNDAGDILLLWTFLDRNTLVIATNESTVSELIARRSTFNQ